MITYTHPGKLFTSFHCDYKANGRSLTFRWPIKYPAARGRHNCQVLHYCLCVRNDGAQAGSRAVFSTSSQVFNIIITSMYLVSSISVTNKIFSCKGVPQLSSLSLLPLRAKWRCPSWIWVFSGYSQEFNSIPSMYLLFSIKYPAKYLVRILTCKMLLGGCMQNDGFQAVSVAVCLKIKFRVRILTWNMLLSVWSIFSLLNVSFLEKQWFWSVFFYYYVVKIEFHLATSFMFVILSIMN